MSNLDARVQTHPDGTLQVFLVGTMDEDTDFKSVFSLMNGDVTINLGGIERLNSIGVHRWIEAIAVCSAQHQVTIEACSYVVALQANCVANLFGLATVRSTLAPYFCSRCNESQSALVTVSQVAETPGAPPMKRCSACNDVMAFDELDTYFDFLAPKNAP